jgi:AcrR family transcriptional regulator
MVRSTRQRERRQGILGAAGRAIARRGYHGVRVKDVAHEAGISSQSVLYYYPDVEELLVEAIQYGAKRYVDSRRETADALSDPAEQLLATIRAGFPTSPYHLSALLFQSVSAFRDNVGLRAMLESVMAQQIELYRRILEVGESRGVFKLADDSRILARNLLALEDAYSVYFVEGIVPAVAEAIGQVTAYAELATGVSLTEAAASLDRGIERPGKEH